MNLKHSRITSICCLGNCSVKSLAMGAAVLVAGFLSPLAAAIQYDDEEFRSEPISTGAAGNVEELRVDSGNAAQGGVVSGAGGVLKTGAGDLELVAENTFTGGLTVREGALSFYQVAGRDDGPLGAAGGAITLDGGVLFSGNIMTLDPTRPVMIGANGGTLAGGLAINQTIVGAGPLTIENYRGWASVTLGGLQNYAGATTVNDAALYIKGTFVNSGGITLLNDSYLQVGEYGAEGVRLGGTLDALNGTVGFYGESAFDGTLNLGSDTSESEYSHVAFFMGKSSAGNSVINVNASGEIQFGDESSPSSAIINNNGGVVDFYSSFVSAASTTIINNVSPAATLIPSGCVNIETWAGPDDAFAIGHLSGSGNVYLGDSTLVLGGLDSRAMLISGTISFGSAYDYGGLLGGLKKIGDFTLTLAAANTYYGPTTLVAGKTVLDTADAISYSALVTLAENSKLVLNADNTLWNLTADSPSAALELANGATVTLVNGITENIDDYNGGITITISDGTTAFAGSITGNGSVIKTGDGSLTLAGANTYTGGTKLEEGELIINSDTALGAANGSIAVAGELIAPTLALAGDVAAAGRALSVAALADPSVPNGTVAACIDTAGHALAIGQGLSGNGRIRLAGGGTLSIAGAIAHTDVIEITGAATLALAGAGSAGHVILADGSLAPAGNQTAGSIEWLSGGTLKIDLDRGDCLNVTGIITRSGASLLNIVPVKSGAWVAGETHVVATFGYTTLASADFATLTFADGLTGRFVVENNAITFTVTSNGTGPVDAYTAWINGFDLPAADRAPSADPDRDGIPNLLEFVLMLNPTAVELEGIVATTVVSGENEYPAVGFVRRRNLGSVQAAVRIYGDLKQAANINPVEVSVEARDTLSDYVIIRSSIPLTQRASQFFRIEASAPASLASPVGRSGSIVALSNPVGAMYRGFTNGRTTTVAFPLLDDVWAGIVSAGSSKTITFGQALPALGNGASYYLEVVTGPRAGDRYDVESVSGKSAKLNLASGSYSTVKNSLPSGLAGARCILREHMTLAKLGQLLDAGEKDATNIATPAHKCTCKKQYLHRGKYNIRALLHNKLYHGHCHHDGNGGGNQNTVFGYSHVEIYQGPLGGWVCYYPDDAGAVWTMQKNPPKNAANKAGTIIAPGTVIKVAARTSGLSLVQTGSVRTNPFNLPLVRGLQLFSTGYPCAMSADELAMTKANGWTGGLLSLLADEIYVINSKTTSSYIHYLDSKDVWRTLLGQKASIVIGPDDHIKVKRMRADADYTILPPF